MFYRKAKYSPRERLDLFRNAQVYLQLQPKEAKNDSG